MSLCERIRGWISPIKATADMTQEVGQRDGQLFTKPGADPAIELTVSALQSTVSGLGDRVGIAEQTITLHGDKISDLGNEIINMDDRVEAVEDDLADKYNASDVVDTVTAGKAVKRTSGGQAKAADPVSDTDLVTLGYFNQHVVSDKTIMLRRTGTGTYAFSKGSWSDLRAITDTGKQYLITWASGADVWYAFKVIWNPIDLTQMDIFTLEHGSDGSVEFTRITIYEDGTYTESQN